MNTVVISCTCNHAFQDAHYGVKRRLANVKSAQIHTPGTKKEARCTVCEKVHDIK